jgi:hypothetical protein
VRGIPLEKQSEGINLVITLSRKEDRTINNHRCENLKFQSIKVALHKIDHDNGCDRDWFRIMSIEALIPAMLNRDLLGDCHLSRRLRLSKRISKDIVQLKIIFHSRIANVM